MRVFPDKHLLEFVFTHINAGLFIFFIHDLLAYHIFPYCRAETIHDVFTETVLSGPYLLESLQVFHLCFKFGIGNRFSGDFRNLIFLTGKQRTA